MTNADDRLSLTEAVVYTRETGRPVSRETLRLAAKSGDLPATQPTGPGGKVYVLRADLDHWLDRPAAPDWSEHTEACASVGGCPVSCDHLTAYENVAQCRMADFLTSKPQAKAADAPTPSRGFRGLAWRYPDGSVLYVDSEDAVWDESWPRPHQTDTAPEGVPGTRREAASRGAVLR